MKPYTDEQITSLTNSLESSQDFVFLETSRVTEENFQSFLFTEAKKWLTCTAVDDAEQYLRDLDQWRDKGFYLAGWIGYEFGYMLEPSFSKNLRKRIKDHTQPLAQLGVFDKPLIYNHKTGQYNQDPIWAEAPKQPLEFMIENMRTNISHHDYIQAISSIKNYILSGDTYQVNFTFKLDFSIHGATSALYQALRKNQSVPYGAWIRYQGTDTLSFSPELFYKSDQKCIKVRPMKGTMSRGRTLAEDESHKLKLKNDAKNISENVMIVDLLRNDLGKLLHKTGRGTVSPESLFDVETYETLLQMTSTIAGTPAKESKQISLSQTLKSLFPCGSITGAPKIRTMEIIDETEKENRGVYCGAIGYSNTDNSVFNVPIRTLKIKKGTGSMGIGSGIVHDSDPEGEWQESLLKSNFLTKRTTDFQLIETILWQPETGYWLLDYHLERLFDSANYFLFSNDPGIITKAIKHEADKLQSYHNFFRVRLLLYRDGKFTITSTQLDRDKPINFETATAIATATVTEPLPTIKLSKQTTDPSNPFFYHKTTKRELYNQQRNLATQKGIHEIIFQNSRNELTEGCISNLFILKNNMLATPTTYCGLLTGTFRRYLLDNKLAYETILTQDDLLKAESIFTGNSVQGLTQVKYLPQHQ